MIIFKKLREWFSLKKKRKAISREKHQKGKGQVLLEMPYNIVHPKDLLESLLMAISIRTLQPSGANVTDVKLYGLYDRDDNSFMGSFYALEQNDGFYGSVVGSQQICFLKKNAFEYKETEKLVVPLKTEAGKLVVLICKYKRKKASLTASRLAKVDVKNMQDEEILHDFEKGTSFDEAYAFYREMA